MRLKIINCHNKSLKKQIHEAVNYYSKQLFHPNLSRNLHISIIFTDLSKKTIYAECYPTVEQRKPRNFIIKLNKSYKQPLMSLAHEMIHVKQYAKDELCVFHKRWKNTTVSESTPYIELPWEKEAYRKDYVLYSMYQEHKKIVKN
jgi:hypothetical protein